jgi:hypothetical protein
MLRAILFATCCSTLFAASGKLILNGKTYVLTHVYARKAPNFFDSKKLSTYVLATDRELSPAARVDGAELRDLAFAGKLTAVELELTGGGISWSLLGGGIQGSMSGSRSPDPYKLTVAAGRVRGDVKMEKLDTMGSTEFYFEFPVDAAIEVKVEPKPPTAADKSAAQSAASTKAYKAYLAVLMSGDKAALIKAVDPAKAKKIDTPEFPQMVKFIQSMQPKSIEVVKAEENGNISLLTVSGNGGAEKGTVRMEKLGGAWIVMKESWTNR